MMTNLPPAAQAAAPLIALLLHTACAAAGAPEGERAVEISGPVDEPADLSGVVRAGGFWWIVSDEGHTLQRLAGAEKPELLRVSGPPYALAEDGPELDLEALAADGDTLFALGSHSHKRPRLKAETAAENRRRIDRIVEEPSRHRLFRVRLDPEGAVAGHRWIDLRPVLADDPLLAPFLAVPGKENGIDLEGLTYFAGKLFAGFRSPVLRDGWVPVMVFEFDNPADYELRFVRLDGHGIRAMAPADDEILLVDGDAQRGVGPQTIWAWNGRDALPGRGSAGRLRRLLDIEAGALAIEGIAVVGTDETHYEVLAIRDGAAGGASLLRLPRRGS